MLAKVVNGPMACVFPLIPNEFRALGKSPSFDTITRDVFPASTIFSISFVLSVLSGIISAVFHLHSKGIMHGDLYAHNILVNDQGQALLVDFGAATVFGLGSELSSYAARIEVRAYGYLMEDLILRISGNEGDSSSKQLSRLQQLMNKCLNSEPELRPTLTEVAAEINSIQQAL